MEERLFNNDRSSSNGSTGLHNLTGPRPKCQPIRIKALLDLWEKDSEDEESEDKPCDSDNGSDNDDLQSLPHDNSICDVPDVASQNIVNQGDSPVNKMASGSVDRAFMRNLTCNASVSLETADIVEHDNAKSMSTFPSVEHRREEQSPVNRSGTTEVTQLDKTNGTISITNFTHSTPSVTYESGRFTSDKRTSLALIDSVQSVTCSRSHVPNVMFEQNKQVKDCLDGVEERRVSQATSEIPLLIVPNKNQQFNSTLQSSGYHEVQKASEKISDIVSPMPRTNVEVSQSIVCNDNCSSITRKTSDPMSYTNGRQLHSVNASSQSEAVSLPSSVGPIYTLSSSASHRVTDTPMKRPPLVSMHPTSSACHRSIFQSPGENFSKNNIQTPSTITSHWLGNNLFQTPSQNGHFKMQESVQTPGLIHTTHNSKFETPRYFGSEKKSVRRPLAENIHSNQYCARSDNVTTYDVDSMADGLRSVQLLRTQETTYESQAGSLIKNDYSRNSLSTEISDTIKGKSVQSAINFNQEVKENKSPNVAKAIKDEKLIQNKVLENKNAATLDTNAKINQLEIRPEGSNVSVPSEANKCQSSCFMPRDQEKQSTKESVVNKMTGVQYSVSSKASITKQREILMVKGTEYLVLGKLGQGMTSEVVRVQDLSNGELRAIKCANMSNVDKETAQGCLEEISMLHKLQAPCVIGMFDYEIKYPMVYVVMEMGDTDLSCLLKSMSPEKHLPLTMILYYWTEMLTAVKHIHDNGVIHSDLKPANFLLVRGRLKLIDFGIASTINADVTSVVKNCSIGTLNYISPEALMDIGGNGDSTKSNGKYKISYKSDVWSLGCILYSLVYGHTPFQHIRVPWAKANAIMNPKLKITFPSRTATEVKDNSGSPPLILVEVMRRCLQHDPKARPTVAQLLDIPYVSNGPSVDLIPPNIPCNILIKIKNSLSEDEWRQLTEILENRQR